MDRTTRIRVTWIVSLVAYMSLAYLLIGRFNLDRSWYLDPSLAFEEHIPFVAEAIYAYILVYVVLLTGFMAVPQPDLEGFQRATTWLTANLTIAFAIFLLVPVRALHRPEIDPEISLSMALTGFYYDFDAPTNLLPSLHVQMALVGGLMCLKRGGLLAVFGVFCVVVVSASVLLVKQHYIADIALAVLIVWLTARWARMGDFRPGASR